MFLRGIDPAHIHDKALKDAAGGITMRDARWPQNPKFLFDTFIPRQAAR